MIWPAYKKKQFSKYFEVLKTSFHQERTLFLLTLGQLWSVQDNENATNTDTEKKEVLLPNEDIPQMVNLLKSSIPQAFGFEKLYNPTLGKNFCLYAAS